MNKLLQLQQELKAPKNLYNSFGKYSYRSAESILEALKPLLAETKTFLIINDELVNIGERYYIKAIVQLYDAEKEHDNLIEETCAYAREEETKKGMDGSQITGASSSYARKYALNGMFLIDDVKDSDATNNYCKEKQTNDDIKQHIENIELAPNRDALVGYWQTLKPSEKKNQKLLDAFKTKGKQLDEIKDKVSA